MTITGIEEAKNTGEAEIIDLLEGKVMQTEETIIQNMNEMFYGDGTGNSNKDWIGLDLIVGKPNTALGGIDPTDSGNSWWKSDEHDMDGALTVKQMGTTYNNVSVGNDQPTIVIGTQALYESYEALLEPNLRYTDTKVADAGFQNLLFKGAPVTFDGDVTAGEIFFLNTKYLRLVAHTETWFQTTPFVRPTNQDARYAQILCYGELTCSNRARQGYIHSAT